MLSEYGRIGENLKLHCTQKDRERAVYGLKEKNLAKTYIKLIPLGMKDPDAVRLWEETLGENLFVSLHIYDNDNFHLRSVVVRIR